MNFYQNIARSLSLALLLTACHKNNGCPAPEGLQGTWIWEKSVGGFGGWTITPDSTGTTRRLEIDDFFYREFENDSLVFESQYDLEIRPDSFLNTNRYLRFSQWDERAVWYDASRLHVHERCADCFSHEYRRQ